MQELLYVYVDNVEDTPLEQIGCLKKNKKVG